MEEILETLEYQDTLLNALRNECDDKEKKELLSLAQMAVQEAVSYLYDLEEEF